MSETHTSTQVLPADDSATGRWNPIIGSEGQRIRDRYAEEFGGGQDGFDAATRVLDSAAQILGTCIPPDNSSGLDTVLAVGHIQSGKTSSISTLIGLARDNGYDLVVLLGGTTVSLLEQTEGRLSDDLELDAADTFKRWAWVRPRLDPVAALKSSVRRTARKKVAGKPAATILISAMKQFKNLAKLNEYLTDPEVVEHLSELSVLIIDDEADQASLNAGGEDELEWTRVYAELAEVRSRFGSVTTVQYTATPQATLLVDLDDALSPSFVHVLDPGAGYTGGETFFSERNEWLHADIPMPEVEAMDEGDAIVPSLKSALAYFWMGCAIDEGQQRSMLIHNSRLTDDHQTVHDGVEAVREEWLFKLRSQVTGVKDGLIDEWLQPAYRELEKCATGQIPDLSELIELLEEVMDDTRLELMNARNTSDIRWSQAPYWILVGGQLLDRGFTVKGLTVTWMPRSKGVGNVDTIQQRARFFGYRKGYIDRCKLWLTPEIRNSFRAYVEHENVLRESLRAAVESGKSLKRWRRSFVLETNAKPTRAAITRLTMRASLKFPRDADGWIRQQFPVVEGDGGAAAAIERNRGHVDQLVEGLNWAVPEQGDFGHRIAIADYEDVYEFLQEFEMNGPRDAGMKLLSNVIAMNAEKSAEYPGGIAVVQIGDRGSAGGSGVDPERRGRQTNSKDPDGKPIKPRMRRVQLFQGASSAGGYPGDSKFFDPERITIQIHRIDIYNGPVSQGDRIFTDVPAIAVRASTEMSKILQLVKHG